MGLRPNGDSSSSNSSNCVLERFVFEPRAGGCGNFIGMAFTTPRFLFFGTSSLPNGDSKLAFDAGDIGSVVSRFDRGGVG